MYTLIDLEKDVENIIQELAEVRAKKGHDYSGEVDTLDNLRAFGWEGVVVRIGDKFHRLKHFLTNKQLKVQDESIEDTLQDLVNYALFALIMYRQERSLASCKDSEGFNKAPEPGDIIHLYNHKPKKGMIVDFESGLPGGEV